METESHIKCVKIVYKQHYMMHRKSTLEEIGEIYKSSRNMLRFVKSSNDTYLQTAHAINVHVQPKYSEKINSFVPYSMKKISNG